MTTEKPGPYKVEPLQAGNTSQIVFRVTPGGTPQGRVFAQQTEAEQYCSALNSAFAAGAEGKGKMREALVSAMEQLNAYRPQIEHKGSCGPWSQCDGNCADAAHFEERMSALRTALFNP